MTTRVFVRELAEARQGLCSKAEDGSNVVTSRWTPTVDIEEDSERFVITADLPGVEPKDIEVTMENGVLTIKGERKLEARDEGDNGYRRVEWVSGAVLAHDLAGALHHPGKAGDAHEHVVRLLGQHGPAGTRERIKGGLGQGVKLALTVAIGEEGEHEQREPVRSALVEGGENAGPVRVSGPALQQRLRLLAPIAAEAGVQQVDHRPQMSALLDVDL